MTIRILDSCGFDSENEIIILIERCLLSINGENKLRMHDLLQDMGREIVNKESPKEPEKHSRLWSSEDICNVLKKQKGTKAIEGIIPYQGQLQEVTLNTETFERMDKLRLLDITNVRLTGNFENIFKELRWLSWQRCDLQCLPSDFHPEKLVILDLQFSKINILWHGILFLEQLKILNLNDCDFLTTTPDFTGIPNLEKLHLGRCKCLAKIHPSIGHLSRLVNLDLKDCKNLTTLPNSLCNLKVLESLCLEHCYNLKGVPEELGNIESLRVLNAGFTAITNLPDSIGCLTKLFELNLCCCTNLKSSSSICKLPLRKLNLHSCKISSGNLLDNIRSLSSLEELDLCSCKISGGNLLDNIGSLSSLKVLGLSSNIFSTLPSSLGQLSNLKELEVEDCRRLRSVKELPPNLTLLSASGCTSMERLPNLSNLKHLASLSLANCSRLVDIQGLEKLNSIRYINLEGCDNLAITFKETLFQVYSGFGEEIDIYLSPRDCPDWFGHQTYGTTICFDVLQNSENKFLGMILWVVVSRSCIGIEAIVENKTNGNTWTDHPYAADRSWVRFIPKTRIAVKFGDKIEASVHDIDLIPERFGVHLVYKTDTIENY